MSRTLAAKGLFRIIEVCLILATASCVTIPRQHVPVSIPIIFQPMFADCSPVDNDALITINKSGSRIFSAAMVWAFVNSRNAAIQFNSPLGDTIFSVSRGQPDWLVTGNVDLQVKESPRGVISVNGYEIPLRASELGCVMSGLWPSEWLNALYLDDRGGGSIVLTGEDELRRIDLSLSISPKLSGSQADDIKSCAVLKWGGFLGLMRKQVSICCENSRESLKMTMTGINDYVIDWMITHES